MLTKNEIKYIRLLKDKKHRDQEKRFVVEGAKSVAEFLGTVPNQTDSVYATSDWFQKNKDNVGRYKVCEVSNAEMERISFLSQPSNVLAIICKPEYEVEKLNNSDWNLILDGIQDPGNFGSIIRICDWFGLTSIWCSPDCADAFNPKVVQATMGSLARVKVHYTPLNQLLKTTYLPIYASAMEGENLFNHPKQKGCLLIGNEGKGISEPLMKMATHKITIPRIGKAESLNAAIATGILLASLTSGS